MPSRQIPCRRCLASLQQWDSGRPVKCEDDDSGSSKCTRCRSLNKPCVAPAGVLRARASALAQALTASKGVRTDAVKEAQIGVKKAIQGQKNAAALPAAKASEAEKVDAIEREERQLVAQERLAAAMEKIGNSFEAFLEAYQGVNAHILYPSQPADDAEDELETGAVGEQ